MKKAINQSTLTLIMSGISVFALFFLIFSLFCFNRVNGKINTANEQRYNLTYNANRFMNGSAYLTNEVRAYAATGDQEHYDNYWNEVNNLKNRDAGVAALKEIGITPEEQNMIDEMSSLSNTLVPLEENAMKNVSTGKKNLAIDYVYGKEYSDSIAKINELKAKFLQTLDDRALGEVNRLIGVSKFIRFFMLLSLFIIGVLQLFNVWIIRRRLLNPIIQIRDQMEEIAQGDLSAAFHLEPDTSEIGMLVNSIHITKRELKQYIQEISTTLTQMAQGNMDLTVGDDYKGEFLPIQASLRQILDALNHALSEINQASGLVSASSETVSAGSQTLSQGAAEQAAAVQELSANIKELTDQVSLTSDNAAKARSCSVDAARQLQISNDKMQELSNAMGNISNASSQIGGIIKTIEDIAFQTNILALNAAVEAARAGAAGKGFAVVADEVRNLAGKSAEAAKNTTSLIENTLRLVQTGSDLTADTTQALLAVVSGAKESTDLVEEIAGSSNQQSEALQELMNGIEQISNVVQTNAASAEESAASAEELSTQAKTLKMAVHRFNLRKNVSELNALPQ